MVVADLLPRVGGAHGGLDAEDGKVDRALRKQTRGMSFARG